MKRFVGERRLRSAMLAAAWIVYMAGCGNDAGTGDIQSDMHGDWLVTTPGHASVLRFSPDETYQLGPVLPEGRMSIFDSLVMDRGRWALEDGILAYVSGELSMSCQQGQIGRYELTAGGDGTRTLSLISDECRFRSLPVITLERFVPTS